MPTDKEVREQQAEIRRLKAVRNGEPHAAEPGKPHRLSISEVARMLLERPTRAASGSVTLTWNAKGDTQVEVVVPTSDELPTIADAAEAAEAVYDALKERYPRASA